MVEGQAIKVITAYGTSKIKKYTVRWIMKIRYDEEADAIYIKLREGEYYESDEISEGIIVDYDRDLNQAGSG